MKKILLVLLTLAPLASHAIVADTFDCDIIARDSATGRMLAAQDGSFQSMRLPMSASPLPEVRMTSSMSSMDLRFAYGTEEMLVRMDFQYFHGFKLSADGKIMDPRQRTCLMLTTSFCKDPGSCDGGHSSCAYANPYDPQQPWPSVANLGDFPAFQEKDLAGSTTAIINDGHGRVLATVEATCRYHGSYQ
jgi:hypothetical protein